MSLLRKKSIERIQADAAVGIGDGHGNMNRVLTVKDLTFFGIAAVIGTGVFTAIGSACFHGGPAVILLFLLTALACGFAAFCYAEFASAVPVSGSAYTYSYVAFGEIFAWIIGWDLLMEYAIGNIAVAISWSQYFVRVLEGFHIHVPEWMTMDYTSAHKGYNNAVAALGSGTGLDKLEQNVRNAYNAWNNAPLLGSFRLIMNVPALLITALITGIVYIGIRESKKANNAFVIIKLVIILVVIIAGACYIKPGNWTPFMPNGFSGVLSGVSAVFFAYIGFDAISTTAEECRDPQRDLPKAMFNTLIICSVLYCILVLVLTGMTGYLSFDNVADPLAFVFQIQHTRAADWIAGIVSVSAVFVIASVLLVYQLGQPRIWMSMSRDGLLPPVFSRIHPKYKTPSFSTILTGLIVGIPALFLNLDVVIALTSIGTLFAFVLVCGGVLVLQKRPERVNSKFRVPFVNGRYIVPAILVVALGLIVFFDSRYIQDKVQIVSVGRAPDPGVNIIAVSNTSAYQIDRATVGYTMSGAAQTMEIHDLAPGDTASIRLIGKDSIIDAAVTKGSVSSASFSRTIPGIHYFKSLFRQEGIPMLAFWALVLVITFLTVKRRYSLIPVLGLVSCFYLMAQESHTNWYRFIIWLAIGLVIYFCYGYRKSKLRHSLNG